MISFGLSTKKLTNKRLFIAKIIEKGYQNKL